MGILELCKAGFMNARNRGAHVAPPQYGHEHLEEQNEEDEKALHADVLKLKSLSIDIGAEIRDQNKQWNEIDDQFEGTFGQLLKNTLKLSQNYKQKTIEEIMAQQGAALQNYNNELVKCLEGLCQRRQRLTKEIEQDTVLLKQVEQEVAKLTAKMNALQTSLNKKIETKGEYDRTIREGEANYMKILETSQALLSMVKKDSNHLQQAEQEVMKTTPSTTPRT